VLQIVSRQIGFAEIAFDIPTVSIVADPLNSDEIGYSLYYNIIRATEISKYSPEEKIHLVEGIRQHYQGYQSSYMIGLMDYLNLQLTCTN
jgi:hypothetical protein